MCLQCSTDAVVYGRDFLPGWQLMRAQKSAWESPPEEWKKDQLGLVRENNPSVVFSAEPVADPYEGMSDDEIEKLGEEPYETQFHEHIRVGSLYEEDVCAGGNPRIVYEIITAAIEVGYDPKEGPNFGFWLADRMVKWLKEHPPVSHAAPPVKT